MRRLEGSRLICAWMVITAFVTKTCAVLLRARESHLGAGCPHLVANCDNDKRLPLAVGDGRSWMAGFIPYSTHGSATIHTIRSSYASCKLVLGVNTPRALSNSTSLDYQYPRSFGAGIFDCHIILGLHKRLMV
jgi:hypothetical protein